MPTHEQSSLLRSRVLGSPVRLQLALALGLGAICFLVFANSIRGKFVLDDTTQIWRNESIGHLDVHDVVRAFTQDFWAALLPQEAQNRIDSPYYRPMFFLALKIGFKIAGLNQTVWHLLGLIPHVLATILAFFMVQRMLLFEYTPEGQQELAGTSAPKLPAYSIPGLAFLAAAIFAVHPVQSESVAWISGLVNALTACFLFSAFLFYMLSRASAFRSGSGNRFKLDRFLALSLLLFSCAVLTKETAITMGGIVLLFEFCVIGRSLAFRPRLYSTAVNSLPYWAIIVVYFVVRHEAVGALLGVARNANFPDDRSLTLLDNLRTIPLLLLNYLKLAAFRGHYSFLYSVGYVRSIRSPLFYLPLVGVCMASILILIAWLKLQGSKSAILWMIFPLAPHLFTLGWVSDELIHDRYLYISMLGFGLMVAILLLKLLRRFPNAMRNYVLAGAAVVLVISAKTVVQNRVWRNSEVLYSNAAAEDPGSREVHLLLARFAESQGEVQTAEAEYKRALAICPDMLDPLNDLGLLCGRQERWDESIHYFERAVSLTPENANLHFNLSFAYGSKGRFNEAAHELKTALALEPDGPHSARWREDLARLQQAGYGVR